MKIDLVKDIKSDVKVEFLTAKQLESHKNKKLLKLAGFEAKQDTICFLHEKALLVCGLEDNSSDNFRSVCSLAMQTLNSSNYKSAAFNVTESNIQAIVEGSCFRWV